jgi:hypothetical protein
MGGLSVMVQAAALGHGTVLVVQPILATVEMAEAGPVSNRLPLPGNRLRTSRRSG